jgi:hypothetical protein
MSSLLVFNSVYGLEIQSVILVFSTPLVYYCPSTFPLTSPLPPFLKYSKRRVYTDIVWPWEGRWVGVDHILQEFTVHSVSDQIQNLQNCYTTPNKNDQ